MLWSYDDFDKMNTAANLACATIPARSVFPLRHIFWEVTLAAVPCGISGAVGAGTAPKPELGTSSQIRIERCKYNAAFQSGVRLEGSPS